MHLSQSSTQLAQAIYENRQMFPDMAKRAPTQPSQYELYQMKVLSSRVEVPRPKMVTETHYIGMDEGDDLYRRVNELETAIHSSQENGIYGASQLDEFEKSLSAESKLVRVP